MSVKEQMLKAKSLIEQKKYDEATAILITVDHPTADKWLDRISKLNSSSQPATVTVQTEKSFTVKLFISIVLLFFWIVPGVIALAIFAPEAKKYPDADGAKALIWLNRASFWILVIGSVGTILFFVVSLLIMAQ